MPTAKATVNEGSRLDQQVGVPLVGEWGMSDINAVANYFFAACEAGKGWDVCAKWCEPNATFSAQAEPLADITTLEGYTNWMKGLMTILPDGKYAMKAWGIDHERNSVSAYAVFTGTHTGDGGPVPPTGKSISADYVYVMQFNGDKISHMTKIWNATWSLRQIGWAP
jgi:predicted ester cyclase